MKTPEEIKQASVEYSNLIKHMDDLHTEACQLDFQAGANWMKDQSTSQIEDLTKEVEELKEAVEYRAGNALENLHALRQVQMENIRYREALEGLVNYSRELLSRGETPVTRENFIKSINEAKAALHPLVKEGEK